MLLPASAARVNKYNDYVLQPWLVRRPNTKEAEDLAVFMFLPEELHRAGSFGAD